MVLRLSRPRDAANAWLGAHRGISSLPKDTSSKVQLGAARVLQSQVRQPRCAHRPSRITHRPPSRTTRSPNRAAPTFTTSIIILHVPHSTRSPASPFQMERAHDLVLTPQMRHPSLKWPTTSVPPPASLEAAGSGTPVGRAQADSFLEPDKVSSCRDSSIPGLFCHVPHAAL